MNNINNKNTFDIYNLDGSVLYTVPKHLVVHLPAEQQVPPKSDHATILQHTKKMTLCPFFNNTNGGCRLAERCTNVHAHINNDQVKVNEDVHLNFAYKELSHVKYERFARPAPKNASSAASAGEEEAQHQYANNATSETLLVAPPNETSPVDEIPIHHCLKTQAFFKPGRIISHCAHYYYNRVCHRGSRCFFIHAVSFSCPRGNNVLEHNKKHLDQLDSQHFHHQYEGAGAEQQHQHHHVAANEFEQVTIELENGLQVKLNKLKDPASASLVVIDDDEDACVAASQGRIVPRRSWGRTQPFRDFGNGHLNRELVHPQHQRNNNHRGSGDFHNNYEINPFFAASSKAHHHHQQQQSFADHHHQGFTRNSSFASPMKSNNMSSRNSNNGIQSTQDSGTVTPHQQSFIFNSSPTPIPQQQSFHQQQIPMFAQIPLLSILSNNQQQVRVGGHNNHGALNSLSLSASSNSHENSGGPSTPKSNGSAKQHYSGSGSKRILVHQHNPYSWTRTTEIHVVSVAV